MFKSQHNLFLETEILTEDVRIIKKFNLGYSYQEDNCKIVKKQRWLEWFVMTYDE